MTAALSNFSNGPYATGVDGIVYPQFLANNLRAPTTNDLQPAGTRWLYNGVIYESAGAGNWQTGGNAPATDTTYGIVTLTDNNEPVATKFYVDQAIENTVSVGSGTLVAGTLTITNPNIATGDVILIQRRVPNASTTLGELGYSIINATSFTVTSAILGTPGSTQTGDLSSFVYSIIPSA